MGGVERGSLSSERECSKKKVREGGDPTRLKRKTKENR